MWRIVKRYYSASSYVIVWADRFGRPKVTVESARQMACLRDPGTRTLTAAIKRWETATTTEAVLYGPDEIVRYRANQTGATTSGFKVVETLSNPLGVPPVVRLLNSDRILDEGVSEIEDLKPLCDALNKVLADMMVSSEYVGRPCRWATRIEAVEQPVLDEDGEETDEIETVNPFPEGNRMMLAEPHEAKFGQLEAANLTGYENAVNVLLGQVMTVSALPAHYCGVMADQPASADALRASEASLDESVADESSSDDTTPDTEDTFPRVVYTAASRTPPRARGERPPAAPAKAPGGDSRRGVAAPQGAIAPRLPYGLEVHFT